MKKIKGLHVTLVFFFIALFLSSCGVMKNNDFQSQKYTNFKKGESSANRNQTIKEKKDLQLFAAVSENKDVTEPTVAAVVEPFEPVLKSVPEINNETIKTEGILNVFTNKANKVKRNFNLSFISSRFANNANTASYHGDVDLLILVLLAIFVPPLSVFLVKGLRNEFWIDIILTCLLWFPGIIYALIVIFDV